MGQVAQLSAGEILEQVWHARASLAAEGGGFSVRNVVFMGMGEPLHNFDALSASLDRLMSPEGMGLSYRRITVSTVGVVDGMLGGTFVRRVADYLEQFDVNREL